MGVLTEFNEKLADLVGNMIGDEGKKRLSGLYAARSAKPDTDVYDQVRLARYILTGSEDPPEVTRIQTADGRTVAEISAQEKAYPYPSGDVLVLGPEIFVSQNEDGNDVICWQGVNFVRQPEPLTGVVGPDPAFVAEPEIDTSREPAPSSGTGWLGRRGHA